MQHTVGFAISLCECKSTFHDATSFKLKINKVLPFCSEDSDLKHKINSHVITVGVSSNSPDEQNVWVDLQFQHLVNLSSSINASCGFLEESASWKLDLCTGVNINVSTTHCLCPKTGTFALFFTTRRVKVSSLFSFANR